MKVHKMSMKKILFLACYTASLCFGSEITTHFFKTKHPVEKMYDSFIQKHPNLTQLITEKNYDQITFERLYTNRYMIQLLITFIMYANVGEQKNRAMIEAIRKRDEGFRDSILNTLISILKKPINPTKPEKQKSQIIFELLHLAVGPEPTLLDILGTIPEDSVTSLSSFYTQLIESMYRTYINVQKEQKTPKNKVYLEQSLHYAQQAYKTMKQYNLLLTFDNDTTQPELIDWLTQEEPSFTDQKLKNLEQNIEKKLKNYAKIKKKNISYN